MHKPTSIHSLTDRMESAPFATDAEYYQAVANAGDRPDFNLMDARLRSLWVATPSGNSTLTGPDGGFLVRPATRENFSRAIYSSPLLSRADSRTDDALDFDGLFLDRSAGPNGGLEVEHVGEGGQLSAVFPKFRMIHEEKNAYYAFIPATNKLLRNSPTVAGDIEAAAGAAFRQLIADGIVNGLGVAPQLLGIRHASNLIVQAIEDTQTLANSASFLAINAAKMTRQVTPLSDAAWFMHQDHYGTLMLSTLGSTQSGAVTPPDADAPFGRLWNLPMFPVDTAPAPGTVGDFMLCAMSDYLVVLKGMEKVVSPHVKFLTNESVFRFAQYIAGQPKTPATITPIYGTTVQSPYVALAARS